MRMDLDQFVKDLAQKAKEAQPELQTIAGWTIYRDRTCGYICTSEAGDYIQLAALDIVESVLPRIYTPTEKS